MSKTICKLFETSRRDSTRLDFVATITTQGRSNRGRNPTTCVNNFMTDTNTERVEELRSLMLDRNTSREEVKYCCGGSGWPGLSKLIYLVFQLWQLWATRDFLYWWKFQIIWTWVSWVWEALALLALLHSGNPAVPYQGIFRRGWVTKLWLGEENFPWQ